MGDVNVQDDLDRMPTRRHRSDAQAPRTTTWRKGACIGNQSFEHRVMPGT
jgi:hypothetical protein